MSTHKRRKRVRRDVEAKYIQKINSSGGEEDESDEAVEYEENSADDASGPEYNVSRQISDNRDVDRLDMEADITHTMAISARWKKRERLQSRMTSDGEAGESSGLEEGEADHKVGDEPDSPHTDNRWTEGSANDMKEEVDETEQDVPEAYGIDDHGTSVDFESSEVPSATTTLDTKHTEAKLPVDTKSSDAASDMKQNDLKQGLAGDIDGKTGPTGDVKTHDQKQEDKHGLFWRYDVVYEVMKDLAEHPREATTEENRAKLVDVLKELKDKIDQADTLANTIDIARKLFQLPDDWDNITLEDNYLCTIQRLQTLSFLFELLGFFNGDGFSVTISAKMEHINEFCSVARGILSYSFHAKLIRTKGLFQKLTNRPSFSTFSTLPSEIGDTLRCILHILKACQRLGLRRHGHYLYAPVYITKPNDTVISTYAYRKYMTISEFVMKQCNRSTAGEFWAILNWKNNKEQIINNITTCRDAALPDLEYDRTISSWQNGIYFAEWHERTPEGHIYGKFIRYEDLRKYHFEKEIVSSKLHNVDFPDGEYKDYMDIETITKNILIQQGYTESEMRIIFAVAGGRFIHKPDRHDHWEIFPYFYGKAGTGKTTWLNLVKNFYPAEDVGAMTSSFEPRFGLWALEDKMLFAAPDVNKEFPLTASDLQSMTSCEMIGVAKKSLKGESRKWGVHGLFAGNEWPMRWKDRQLSMVRRVLLIVFNNMTAHKDTQLEKKILQNFGHFFRICNEAYLDLVNQLKGSDLNDALPEKFLGFRNRVQNNGNPVVQFLNDQHFITPDPDSYCLQSSLIESFNTYKRKWMLSGRSELSPGRMAEVCDLVGYKTTAYIEKEWPIGSGITERGVFVLGLRLTT